MPGLREFQTAFARSMLANETEPLDGVDNHRLHIYRNNIGITLCNALRCVYPAVEKIVGEDFFNGLAHAYIRKHPSCFRNINDFGGEFANFLAGFSPVNSLPYLPEIACLEWGCHEILHAADMGFLDLRTLQTIPEEKYDTLRFCLHPASRLFSFQFPVFNIWQLCQDESNVSDIVNLDEGSVKLLASRRATGVALQVLTAGEFVWLSALADKQALGVACQRALNTETDFNVEVMLKKHILSGTLNKILF